MGTSTIKASGGDYTSLSAWEAAKQADITGNGPEIAECYDVDDTSDVAIAGWTTTASDYIQIKAATANRVNGVSRAQNSTSYRLSGSASAGQLRIAEDYVRVEGIEVRSTGAQAVVKFPLTMGASNDVRIDDCVIHSGHTSASTHYIAGFDQTNLNLTVTNCLIVGKARGCDTRSSSSVAINHCTFYTDAASLGLVCESEATVTNTYAGGYSTEDYWTGGTAPSGSHNASSDTSASTDYTNTVTSAAATDQFTSPSVTDSSWDFTLKSGNSLANAGTGSEAQDIADTNRSGTVDIGCFEAAGGGATIPVFAQHYRNQGMQ